MYPWKCQKKLVEKFIMENEKILWKFYHSIEDLREAQQKKYDH